MKYYLDCEFDNQGASSPLLSMALVREDGRSLYITTDYASYGVIHDAWVAENVMPILTDYGDTDLLHVCGTRASIAVALGQYFKGDEAIHVISDWPVDIKYLCDALITGPGTMIDIPRIWFEVARVDAYPTELEGAVQHNAWWDAMALRHKLTCSHYQPELGL